MTIVPEPAPRIDLPWPTDGFSFGGDYNPEQWDRTVWREDIALMREAGVTLVTLGVFSWGLLEVEDGVFDFNWLDEVIGLLSEAGIAIDLATPTAAPPIWLHQEHPEILPVAHDGHKYWQGGRLGWCASSATWRFYSTRIVRELAARYGNNPAVRMWHVSNELGGGNRWCYCDESAAHFRRWLAERYTTVSALNLAWGTAFWGHHYTSFDQVLPPRDSESAPNPALVLDFERFSSDALLAHYVAERDVIREYSPNVPVTTNFMVTQNPGVVDYATWAKHVDFSANDHYVIGDDSLPENELAFSADRMRGFNPSRPWLLLEHSTSAVNWQPRNFSKAPGELIRHSLSHIARGSDGAMFFQWRASTAGAEQFHSAMVPHVGTRSKIWHDVCELGAILGKIAEVAGSIVEPARVAILFDDTSGWAWASGQKPDNTLRISEAARHFHRALWARGIVADVVPPDADLSSYDLVIIAGLYLVDSATADRVYERAEQGATVVVTYLSGIVDETNRVLRGGYPGAFRDMLGVFGEEFFVLGDNQSASLDTGWKVTRWSEKIWAMGSDVFASYADGVLAGSPAITRRSVGAGEAWYLSAHLDGEGLEAFVDELLLRTEIVPKSPPVVGVEVVRRLGRLGSYAFALNHTDHAVSVALAGWDLLHDMHTGNQITIPPGGVAVIREDSEKVGDLIL